MSNGFKKWRKGKERKRKKASEEGGSSAVLDVVSSRSSRVGNGALSAGGDAVPEALTLEEIQMPIKSLGQVFKESRESTIEIGWS